MARDELGEHAPSPDLSDRIRKALEAARAAAHSDAHGQASRQCDEVLAMIDHLPQGRERTELQIQALRIKARAVRFPVGIEQALQIDQQVLGLLELLGDKGDIASHLRHMGVQHAGNGEKQKSAEAYQRALDLYREMGDKTGQGTTLTWLGAADVPDAPADALARFEQGLSLLRGGPRRDAEALCSAALELLRGAGPSAGTKALRDYHAACAILQTGPDGVRFVGEPGFGGRRSRSDPSEPALGGLGIDVLNSAAQDKWVIRADRHPGDTWQARVFSHTKHPLRLTGAVVADGESVGVPAGSFGACLHVRLDIGPDPDDDGPERQRRINRVNCGEKHIWYARGVGLVRLTFDRLDGVRADVQLARYRLSDDPDCYLPLAVGNRWEYRAMGFKARYVQQRVYEVLAAEPNPAGDEIRYYLPHWAFAYPEEDGGEN